MKGRPSLVDKPSWSLCPCEERLPCGIRWLQSLLAFAEAGWLQLEALFLCARTLSDGAVLRTLSWGAHAAFSAPNVLGIALSGRSRETP